MAKKDKINDVLGIFVPKVIKSDDFTLDVGVIKLGDWDKGDETFLDLTTVKKWKNISVTVEIGRGVCQINFPRDYVIARLAHSDFTIEGGLVSKKGYSNIDEFAKDKYYWAAYHPKNIFAAVGSEISRTWLLAGTRDLKNFGNLTVANYDRENKNFWFRSQCGFGQVN